MALRHLSEEPLRVTADLRGAPLASPARRGLALAIDFALLLIPSIALVAAVALLTLRLQDPAAFRALPAALRRDAPPAALAAIAPLLVRCHAQGLPPEVAAAVHRGDLAQAAALLRPYHLDFMLSIGEHGEQALRGATIRMHVEEVIPPAWRALASYGLMGLYFGLLTAGRRGQTLGKRLLGIRVVRLDGHRLSKMESVERFAGYLHIPGSLGLGLLDLWREPNRRMAHDRVAHTAVVRVAATPVEAAAPVDPPAAAEDEAPSAPEPGGERPANPLT